MLEEQIITLFSKQRLESYNNDLDKHFENLRLIARITPKIAVIEIILRNMLDSILTQTNPLWIENSKDKIMVEAKNKITKDTKNTNLTHHQYLSRLTFGIIIHIIKKEKLQNKVMNLENIKFKTYDSGNRDFKCVKQKSRLRNFEKVNIVLSLLQNLRNRSYHWENIMKTTQKQDKTYPRITTKQHNVIIGIHPDNIELFLDDIIKTYGQGLLDIMNR